MDGFLGAGATFRADLNLVIQILMGLALLGGLALARRGRFTAHKYCQSSVMLLNLAMIGVVMAPSFHHQVEPRIPAGLGDSYYAVAAAHAALGTLAELLGLYIVLAAATRLLPEGLRLKRYKPWMRATLGLWWMTILLGLGTYYVWYLAPTPQAAAPAAPAERKVEQPGKVTVTITNFAFDPKELTVAAGATVEWVDSGGRHTVEADDGSFKSETLVAGGRFEHRFDRPGTFAYHCDFHGAKGGAGMTGVIKVTPPGGN